MPDFNSHREPLNRIYRTLHSAANNGATRAHIDIHSDHIEYRDDRPYQTIIRTGAVDPDLLLTMDHAIESYVPQPTLHVHVSKHAHGRRAMHEPDHRHLRNPNDNNVVLPQMTAGGRYMVYLADRPHNQGLTVINHDGTRPRRHGELRLDAKYTETREPAASVKRRSFPVIAMPAPGTRTPADGADIDRIIETATRMLVLHMNQYNSQPEGGLMWPDLDSLRTLPAHTIREMPPRPQTCRWHDGKNRGYDEMLLPANPAVPALSFTHGQTLTMALNDNPYPNEQLDLVNDHAEGLTEPSRPVEIPVIVLVDVTVTELDGSVTKVPVPRYDHEQRYPHPREKRLHSSRSGQVQDISLTLEYRTPGQEPVPFAIPAHIYADQDQDDFVILTTPELDMTPREIIKASEIHHFHHKTVHFDDGPMRWFPAYQARRAIQDKPNQANQHILATIAQTIEDMGIAARGNEEEITVNSLSGNVAITLRPTPA